MKDFDLMSAQVFVFEQVGKEISTKLPKDINFTNNINEQTIQDLEKLNSEGKLGWNLPFKLAPFMNSISNYEHPVYSVIYYGDKQEGYSCIGFFLGCVNEEKNAIELNYIEKRNDAHDDLRHCFFASTNELLIAYASWLNLHEFNINTIALIDTLEYIKPHYQKYGYKIDKTYTQESIDVMTLKLLPTQIK